MNKQLLDLWAEINEADNKEFGSDEVFNIDWTRDYLPSTHVLEKYKAINKVIEDLNLTDGDKQINSVYKLVCDLFELYNLTPDCDPFYYELHKVGAWYYCNNLDVEHQFGKWLLNFQNFLA